MPFAAKTLENDRDRVFIVVSHAEEKFHFANDNNYPNFCELLRKASVGC